MELCNYVILKWFMIQLPFLLFLFLLTNRVIMQGILTLNWFVNRRDLLKEHNTVNLVLLTIVTKQDLMLVALLPALFNYAYPKKNKKLHS